MGPKLAARIERARGLLQTVRHAALATVNADGTPHNSPVFAGFGNGTTMYWASSPDAVHSQNIIRTGQVFIVLFDSMNKGGGLYLACKSGIAEGEQLAHGLEAFNTSLARLGRSTLTREHVTGAAPQRLFYARPWRAWVNMSQKDTDGRVIHDARYEVELTALI